MQRVFTFQVEAIPAKGCSGCIGVDSRAVCDALPPCGPDSNNGNGVIFVAVAKE